METTTAPRAIVRYADCRDRHEDFYMRANEHTKRFAEEATYAVNAAYMTLADVPDEIRQLNILIGWLVEGYFSIETPVTVREFLSKESVRSDLMFTMQSHRNETSFSWI